MQRCSDWTTHECVQGGRALDEYGSGIADSLVDEAATDDELDTDGEFLAPTGATDDQIADAIVLASDILFGLTMERYPGTCGPVKVRPCRKARRGGPAWPMGAQQRALVAQWWRWDPTWLVCNCDSNPCGCGGVDRIGIGVYPIVEDSVTVMLDGVELDPANYVVVEHRWLDRIDGELWPTCRNPDLPDTEPNTFSVTCEWGNPVPDGGRAAACYYARQMAMGFAGVQCELPSRVASIVRQGVTYSFRDPSQLVDKGLTGVDLVDQWVNADNRNRPGVLGTTFIIPGVARQEAQIDRRGPTP